MVSDERWHTDVGGPLTLVVLIFLMMALPIFRPLQATAVFPDQIRAQRVPRRATQHFQLATGLISLQEARPSIRSRGICFSDLAPGISSVTAGRCTRALTPGVILNI